jgi:hypothetical protein
MSKEITVSASLSVALGGSSVASSRSVALDIVGTNVVSELFTTPYAADQALDLSNLANLGYLLIENLDATNFLQISTATGGGFAAAVFAKVRPLSVFLAQPGTKTLYIKADTAAVITKMTAVEI